MPEKLRNVAQMRQGEVAIIADLTDDFLAVKLMEMGCLPGVKVRLNFRAPFGDPVCISVSGYQLSLRLDEAAAIAIMN